MERAEGRGGRENSNFEMLNRHLSSLSLSATEQLGSPFTFSVEVYETGSEAHGTQHLAVCVQDSEPACSQFSPLNNPITWILLLAPVHKEAQGGQGTCLKIQVNI